MIGLKKHLIMEANKKSPSGLGKIKDKSVERDVEFITGDIYDLSDGNRYTDKFKYYNGEGNGYITDKAGHVYDVFTSTQQGDAGRIAGGSTYRYVTIKNVAGTDIHFSGYSAIFSSSHGMDIISDIKAGMYLEDYLAKHWNDMSSSTANNEDIIKLKDKGDANAKTYTTQQEESKEERTVKFWERYIILEKLHVSVKNGAVELGFEKAFGYDTPIYTHFTKNMKKTQPSYEKPSGDITDEEWKQTKEDWENEYEEYRAMIVSSLTPVITKMFSKKFNRDLTGMNGVNFDITAKGSSKYILARLGFDTKKKQFVELDWEKPKLKSEKEYANEHVELVMGPTITLVKDDASDEMIEIFTQAAKTYNKLNKGKKTEWVAKNWHNIWTQGNEGSWLYGKRKMTTGEAKKIAGDEYQKDLAEHTWNTSGKTITFMTEFISQFMTAPEKIEDELDVELNVDTNNMTERIRGKFTKLGKNARSKQEEKMDAWHNGERKQNVANCSDAKLKMNYEICVQKGYDKEAAQLKAEAAKRGIVLESLAAFMLYN